MPNYFYNIPPDPVVDGPKPLPDYLQNEPDEIKNKHGWFEYMEEYIPPYTPVKQKILRDYAYLLQDNKVYNRWVVVDLNEEQQTGELVRLENIKNTNIEVVNQIISKLRSQYITTGAGQELTYQQKMLEVQRYETDTQPTGSNYPYLQAEATATEMSLNDVYVLVKNTAEQWKSLGASIEGLRRGTIVAINKATDEYKIGFIIKDFMSKVETFK